jgi:hypothetical protein
MIVALIVLLFFIGVPIALLVWRFTRGEESVAGGSMGSQFFGRKQDDWGPKP